MRFTVKVPRFEPPYVAVIFSSVLKPVSTGYGEAITEMFALAAEQPGYLGVESVRDPDTGAGITVSYWRSEADAAAWKQVAEHRDVQAMGRQRWYSSYTVHVATVTRAYAFEGSPTPG